MEVENDKGDVEKWAAELGTLGVLSRINWRRDSVKPGDQITIYGNPARDGRSLMRLMKVVLPNGQELSAGRAQQ
jgi:hydrogenase maturation factor